MVFIKTVFPLCHLSVHGPMTSHSGIAGVPALRNDFQDSDFMRSHYHSQFDNEDTYNADALKFHLNLYGLLSMHYDQTAVVPLDFTTRLMEMKDEISTEVFLNKQVFLPKEIIAEIDNAIAITEKVNANVDKVNEEYFVALTKGDAKKAKKLYEESRELNSGLLAAFKYAEDRLVRFNMGR